MVLSGGQEYDIPVSIGVGWKGYVVNRRRDLCTVESVLSLLLEDRASPIDFASNPERRRSRPVATQIAFHV